MKSYEKLLLANKMWAANQVDEDPGYFKKMALGQNPEFLWIGCADSRAPADKITGTEPGQIFVHRNVANLVIDTDFNMLSVLQYAIEVLKVNHVMVVGHYGCGGVKASMTNSDLGIINKWIRTIKDTYVKFEDELMQIEDFDKRADRLCEINVVEQVKNLAKTSIIQRAWSKGEGPHLHGWILDLETGKIKQIMEVEGGDTSIIEPIFRYQY